ncbi:hypothetical protein Mapa_004128 [Marchantia paleacea]|nr:hypothetical protein Mapa_004128 [Marchantia paleacea]
MLFTIRLLASSFTEHRSEIRIIFRRCLAISALELDLRLVGKRMVQARTNLSKKF